jgi:hypothetical protein
MSRSPNPGPAGRLAGVVTTHCHGDDSELPELAAGATTRKVGSWRVDA